MLPVFLSVEQHNFIVLVITTKKQDLKRLMRSALFSLGRIPSTNQVAHLPIDQEAVCAQKTINYEFIRINMVYLRSRSAKDFGVDSTANA